MTTATNAMTAAQQPELSGQLIAVLYSRGRTAVYTNPVIGLLSVVALAEKMSAGWLAAWFALLCLHAFARYALIARYERVRPPAREAQRWGRYMAVITTTSGILWGLVAIVV